MLAAHMIWADWHIHSDQYCLTVSQMMMMTQDFTEIFSQILRMLPIALEGNGNTLDGSPTS